MASLLRQIVASPRARHPEAGLDLCYVTDNIIATSGPSGSYPKRAYRNPLDHLVKYLDKKHAEKWAIWEFRAEGTGYPDSAVYNRIWHYPWPDHHPPPFALIPNIVASMRNWLKGEEGRVVVVHCKAGKGRSGTSSCSYLISEEGWSKDAAMERFTERRMRPGFGAGVSIPSQVRWLGYVERWAKNGKFYVERKVQVTELRIFGLRDGVKVVVEGFEDEGKVIKQIHAFKSSEREIVRGEVKERGRLADVVAEILGKSNGNSRPGTLSRASSIFTKSKDTSPTRSSGKDANGSGPKTTDEHGLNAPPSKTNTASGTATPNAEFGGDVIFRPSSPIVVPTSDINIDFERRSTAAYNLTMVTSVAHVWFNCFFEGKGPENATSGRNGGQPETEGVFELEWDKLDGIKGSSKKGTRAFDRVTVSWKVAEEDGKAVRGKIILEPEMGQEVKQATAADWKGKEGEVDPGYQKDLGIRKNSEREDDEDGTAIEKAHGYAAAESDDDEGTKPMGQSGEERVDAPHDEHEGQPEKSKTTPAPSGQDDDAAPGIDIPLVQSPDSMPGTENPATAETKDGTAKA